MNPIVTSDLQSAINEYWTERAPSYDDYQQRPERREADRRVWSGIWATALPDVPASVLDVGTGSGHVAMTLAGLGFDVTGIDLAGGMLDRAREHAAEQSTPPRLLVGDATAPDFAPETFDAVVGRYVLWTLREPVSAVRAWARLLRPGGVVAMADSTWFPEGMGELYGPGTADELPLAEAGTIERSAEAMRAGGLLDVQVRELTEVLELDRTYGVAPGHHVQSQYLLTGRVG